MKITIDRFEGEFVVVEIEFNRIANMPKCLLPSDALEGDVISIEIDRGETEKRVNNIKRLENNLFED